MLYLTGYGLTLDDLRGFRRWGSRTPGHPELNHTPGVEVTTGPLGQGVANGVGMGIAERWLRTHYSPEVCDHHTFVIAGDGCFEEGISHEAASLAGHLGLGRLVYVYDDNHITIDGPTELSYSDDVGERFDAYGWNVDDVGEIANDLDALEAALRRAMAEEDRPSLVILRSHIGYPSPHLTDTAKAHGDPFSEEEIRLTKELLGLPPDESFWVPDDVLDLYRACIPRGRASGPTWEARFASWGGDKARWEAGQAGHGLPGWEAKLPTFAPEDGPMATRKAIKACLDATGRVDPRPHARQRRPHRQHRHGHGRRHRPVGRRARRQPHPLRHPRARHGRGDERHGRPPGGPAGGRHLLRLQRLHARRGPPGRALRRPRHLLVDPRLRRAGPGRAHPPARRAAGRHAGHAPAPGDPSGRRQRDRPGVADRRRLRRAHRAHPLPPGPPGAGRDGRPGRTRGVPGGLRPREPEGGGARVVLIGTGSEVQLCLAAADLLAANGLAARVVSFPSWDLFAAQDEGYRHEVLPAGVPRLAVEAASPFGWERYADATVGIDHFGASAPGEVAMEEFGFTPEHVATEAAALVAGRSAG